MPSFLISINYLIIVSIGIVDNREDDIIVDSLWEVKGIFGMVEKILFSSETMVDVFDMDERLVE